MVENARTFEGKKYMWDGLIYESEEEAKKAAETYAKDDFETKVVEEKGKYFVYSRRVVTEIILE
ncbi:hypothetical protein DRP07_02915 [Archaeoglobales archaeon]|nr:MAG: hypothetical protein DRP07_02915 [Archaeoglobales archaeon]